MNLNLVETTVSIAGSNVVFTKLTLNQRFNSHHHCEILVDYDAFGDKSWMADPVKIINYVGEGLAISFVHAETGETNTFIGFVKNVFFTGYHGADNHIVIEGTSETARLSGKPNMDSFVNKTLEELVKESVKNSGNGAAVVVKPEYKQPIDFQMQYNESAFDFLNRLSFLYGESFYSKDGSEVFFGKPELDDAIDVKYDIELLCFGLKASLMPPKFKHYNYLQFYHEEKLKETRKDVPDAAGYLQPALSKSESIYTSDVTTPVGALVHDPDSLLKMIDIERTREVANMLVLSGTSQTCKVGLGRVISVSFPGNLNIVTSPGAFIVTEVTHTVNLKGHYENTFSGVRAALGYIPVPSVALPVTSSQRATVVSNADPEGKGRIQVQMQFQKYMGKETNWIRVQTPDAGSSNVFPNDRGYIFIPEVGDEVMIQFEDNDPARPYCSGSLFPETKSRGGKENNHLKSIKTRSGHMIEFNDSDSAWGITITDKNDNCIFLDTQGKSIRISAPEKISILSKDIEIVAKNQLVLSSEKDTQQTVGTEFVQNVGGDATISYGKNLKTTVDSVSQTRIGKDAEIEILGGLKEIVNKDIKISSGKKAEIQSQSDLTLKSGANVYISE